MQWLQIADDVAVLQYPLRALGINFGRNVTLLRLADGRVVIHSTAPFTAADVEAITGFGKPSWLVEATRLHDTFARPARAALPDLPYLAPGDAGTRPLIPSPPEWAGEVEVLRIAGLRSIEEHAFYHRRSRTLVVADLVFQFPPGTRGWARFFVRHIMRLPHLRGVSVFFRLAVRDRSKFESSMRTLLDWDFTRIVLAHREPVRHDAKAILREALREARFFD